MFPGGEERLYYEQVWTIPANKSVEVPLQWTPDWWVVVPAEALPGTVRVSMGPGYSGVASGGFPMQGQNPFTLPGVSDRLVLRNQQSISASIIVTAGKGYPAPVLAMPTIPASPSGPDILAQTTIALVGAANPYNFNHDHIGGSVLVWVSSGFNGGGVDEQVTGLTIGGVAALEKQHDHQFGGNNGHCSKWYWLTGVPPGIVQISISHMTVAAAVATYAMAFSYADMIRVGNVGGRSAPGSFSITSQDDSSVAFCGALTNGVLTETSGATLYDGVRAFANGDYGGVYRRTGKGTMNWTFGGGGWLVASACEVLPV